MSEAVLKIENLSKSYVLGKRSVQALSGVNLKVNKANLLRLWDLLVQAKRHC